VIRFLADENLAGSIVAGLVRRNPAIDIVRAQDVVGLSGADDETLLEWAAPDRRVLLTHDIRTVPRATYRRLQPGIEEVLLICECSSERDWQSAVDYLPL
jgi:hypothetical protein